MIHMYTVLTQDANRQQVEAVILPLCLQTRQLVDPSSNKQDNCIHLGGKLFADIQPPSDTFTF